MTAGELRVNLSLTVLSEPEPERNVNGGYAGDLLSWVMGRASADNVWVTIMTNVNIVAVATLADVSCIIIAENAEIEESVVQRAFEKGVNIYKSEKPTFELCGEISKLI